jgi:hypothetical protein
MKKFSLPGLGMISLLMLIFLFASACPAQAQEKDNLVGVYRQFFNNLADARFTDVWQSLSVASKTVIASEIAKNTSGKFTTAQVLDLLEKDTNSVRTKFFEEFTKGFDPKLVTNGGKFSFKSANATKAVVTIQVQGDALDVSLAKEEGQWKVNFFHDVMMDGK